jgi:nucleoside-diphosphate kinase
LYNRTLALIKPDAREHTAAILHKIQAGGFHIVAKREFRMTRPQVEWFYREHRDKPFFPALVDHMTSDTVTVLVLETDPPKTAWQRWRDEIGRTDPMKAEYGTIRWEFGREQKLPKNVVHGSDGEGAVEREIPFFFAGCDLIR